MDLRTHFLLLVWLSIVWSKSLKCPSKSSLAPCKCHEEVKKKATETTIHCSGNQPLELREVFKKAAKITKEATNFYLDNTNITSLPADVFHGISFESITIDGAVSLQQIHSSAFKPTNSTRSFVSKNCPLLANPGQTSPSYDLFKALSALPNLTTISLSSAIEKIPDFAFNHSNLVNLQFRTSRIKSIGKHSFYRLNNVRFISLDNQNISSVDAQSLKFEKSPQKEVVTIFLRHNRLGVSSFKVGSLDPTGRRIHLNINDNDNIDYLNETVFRPFLEAHNVIEVQSFGIKNVLNCSDCRNQWISANRFQFQNSVRGGNCNGGPSILLKKPEDFQHCDAL